MPKHQFAMYKIGVKSHKPKNPERLVQDFTGRKDDLLDVFDDYLANEIGSGVSLPNDRYLLLDDKRIDKRYLHFTFESGTSGQAGQVRNTKTHKSNYQLKTEDAPTYLVRNVLAVPKSGDVAILATEIVGAGGCFPPLWNHFRPWFRKEYTADKIIAHYDYIAPSKAWEAYVKNASLQAVTFTQHEYSKNKAKRTRSQEMRVAAGRGEVLPTGWKGGFVGGTLNPGSVVTLPAGFQTHEIKLELEHKDGPRTIVVTKELPKFLFPLSEAGKPRPTQTEFETKVLSAVDEYLGVLGVPATQMA